MSIINTFDAGSEEIIKPSEAIKRIEDFPETLIAVFNQKFADMLTESFYHEEISYMIGGIKIPIYKVCYRDKTLGFYQTLLGGAGSAGLLEEIIAKGGRKILYFGACGVLDKDIAAGRLLIPTAAYRDEGTSYHYAPPSDYIEVKTAGRLAEIFDELGAPYCKVKTWTTDAFYRETKNNMLARKADGCSVVEMECASVMATGQFRGAEVYQFLYAADCLDGESWDERILGKTPKDMTSKILKIALETAIRL